MDGRRTPPVREDRRTIQAAIDVLAARIDAFEHQLQQAMASEQTFRHNLQTVTEALDSFVERHRQEDMQLTEMIQEDTQRSREARDEYDVLAARFDDSIRPRNPSRRMDFLKNVSLYISIVVSVVFMAPLHAVVWLFESLLYRLGYRKQVEAYGPEGVYADSAVRYRARQSSSRMERGGRASSTLRHRSQANASATLQRSTTRPSPGRQLQNQSRSSKESVGKSNADKQNAEIVPEMHLDISNVVPLTSAAQPASRKSPPARQTQEMDSVAAESSKRGHRSPGQHHLRGQSGRVSENESDSSDPEKEFLDASAGAEGPKQLTTPIAAENSDEEEGEESNSPRDDGSGRPDWAQPAGSDAALPELSTFPSSDFWNISEDEIRLEFLRRESRPNSPRS